MGQKTSIEEIKSKSKDFSFEPDEGTIIEDFGLEYVDEILDSIFPDEIGANLKKSLIKKMSVIKYAKKVFKEFSCLQFDSSQENINGIKYYLAFISIKKKDDTITLGYIFLYNNKEYWTGYTEQKKGNKVISKNYINDLEEVNKIFGALKSKAFIENMNQKWIETKKLLSIQN